MALLNFFDSIDAARYLLTDEYSERGGTFNSKTLSANHSKIKDLKITFKGEFQEFYDPYYDDYGFKGPISSITLQKKSSKLFEFTKLQADFFDFDETGLDYGGTAALQYLLRGNDTINGSAKGDTLKGYNGNDTIRGNNGNDFIDGGRGNDKLIGGAGKDVLTGSAGADMFIFEKSSDSSANSKGRDIIRDFSSIDLIVLEAIDANVNRRGDQDFRFIGGKDFSKSAGELRVEKGVVMGDTNGDGKADFSILVQTSNFKAASLNIDDFIL